MKVVGTIDYDGDEIFLGIWDNESQFWDWFRADYPSLQFVSSGHDNDSSFMGSLSTYPTKWRKYRDETSAHFEKGDIIVQVYFIR